MAADKREPRGRRTAAEIVAGIDPQDLRDHHAREFLTGGPFGVVQICGVCAVVEYDPDIAMFHGAFRGLNGVATFYGETIDALKTEGRKTLIDYKQTCDAEGIAMFHPNAPQHITANAAHIEASLAAFDRGDFDTVEREPSGYEYKPCPICYDGEREDRMTPATRDIEIEHKGVNGLIFDVTGIFCDVCGESILDDENGDQYMQKVAVFVAEVEADLREDEEAAALIEARRGEQSSPVNLDDL